MKRAKSKAKILNAERRTQNIKYRRALYFLLEKLWFPVIYIFCRVKLCEFVTLKNYSEKKEKTVDGYFLTGDFLFQIVLKGIIRPFELLRFRHVVSRDLANLNKSAILDKSSSGIWPFSVVIF